MKLLANLALCGILAVPALAQDGVARKPVKETAAEKEIKLGEDEPGCKDSTLLARMPGCSIIQCDTKETGTVEIQVGASAEGLPQKEIMEGAVETIYYLCPAKSSAAHVTKLAETTLVKDGYKLVFSGKDGDDMPLVTTMKELQWMQVSTYMYNEYTAYIQTALTALPENEADFEALAAEITASGHAALPGIAFAKDKAELPADAEKILEGVAAFLVRQPEMKIRVEGHTYEAADKQGNLVLSQQRASAVATWLLEHGIDKARLSILGLGDSKPAAAGSAESGRARSSRIELVRF